MNIMMEFVTIGLVLLLS